tara:strand:+ start:6834 stop:7475 length:642 start_codon:yes stop_codon:yes gene_type:complete
MKKKYYKIIIFILFLILILFYFKYKGNTTTLNDKIVNGIIYAEQLEHLSGLGLLDSQHIHADYKVFIEGKEINMSYPELQAPEWGSAEFWRTSGFSRFVHMHPGENQSGVIHIHAIGVRLGMFFRVIGGSLNHSCISFPELIQKQESVEQTYCSDSDNILQVLVNGEKIINPDSYLFHDLDRILISYGKISQTNEQMKSVGYQACIHSENCDE